jgi:multidrug efflux pump subunit AcrA (membrane-fusion protein)
MRQEMARSLGAPADKEGVAMAAKAASLIACAGMVFLSGCMQPPPAPPPPRTVAFIAAADAARAEEARFPAVVAPTSQADVGFRVGGRIVQRLVDVGDTIARGQVLARLDPTDLMLNAQASSAQIDAAVASGSEAQAATADAVPA